MKFTLLALFLLFSLGSQLLLGASNASPEEVLDTSGKKLRTDTNYYIIPAKPFIICGIVSCFNGGGLVLDTFDETCPLDVMIEKANDGLPLQFSPINPKMGVIRVSTDLNIMFSAADQNNCPQYSTVWKLGDYDASNGQTFVSTGGDFGNPSSQTIKSWFKIEKYEDAYKLVYCPSVCKSCKHLCKDIGIFEDKNKRMHLALSDDPFKVKFKKV
ncbi:miraculin-like [Arachis stenosperma]|uniref:miraculin-like n=1 Tax=Arachis stenosperma TaxID=217475 RepID=UPI0025ABBCC6|nr:miraculin-like [Arachis stenosperma]